jgi:hypothetical protein
VSERRQHRGPRGSGLGPVFHPADEPAVEHPRHEGPLRAPGQRDDDPQASTRGRLGQSSVRGLLDAHAQRHPRRRSHVRAFLLQTSFRAKADRRPSFSDSIDAFPYTVPGYVPQLIADSLAPHVSDPMPVKTTGPSPSAPRPAVVRWRVLTYPSLPLSISPQDRRRLQGVALRHMGSGRQAQVQRRSAQRAQRHPQRDEFGLRLTKRRGVISSMASFNPYACACTRGCARRQWRRFDGSTLSSAALPLAAGGMGSMRARGGWPIEAC